MTLSLDITELREAFPQFRVAVVVAEGLSIPAERPPELDAVVRGREAACLAAWEGQELSAIPGVAAWRAAYKGFGIKKTSYRCSVERLVKNVLAGRGLPRVNGFVDAYNAVSLSHVLCVGADDLDKTEGPFAFRYARPGDSFVDMAAEPGEDPDDPPKAGEVVYADARHVLCRRWNWRQDARTIISPDTRRAVITLQSNGVGDVVAAADDLIGLLERICSARCALAVADADHPRLDI